MTWPEIAKAIKPIKTLNAECTAEWLHGLLSTLPKSSTDSFRTEGLSAVMIARCLKTSLFTTPLSHSTDAGIKG